MENKIEILKKLGFSNEFLRIIEQRSQISEYQSGETSSCNFGNVNISSSDLTSLIIEKTEKQINSNFIFNEI